MDVPSSSRSMRVSDGVGACDTVVCSVALSPHSLDAGPELSTSSSSTLVQSFYRTSWVEGHY